MLKIEFDKENMDKCLCPDCPVQSENACIKDQVKEMEEIGHDIDIDLAEVIQPEEVPKLYCSTGKTRCKDLRIHEECQCPKCDVWNENDLGGREAPAYFCINGRAVDCCKIISNDAYRESKARELRRTYYTPI